MRLVSEAIDVMDAIGRALALAGSMTWEILWALILGFALSAVVQAVVRKSAIVGLLGDDRPRTLAVATGLGAASSSCSYAAVALARSLFRKGANFTAAMAFEIASTNLVVQLGVILALLYWALEIRQWRGSWTMPILVFGTNAIAAFVADSLVYGPGYSFNTKGLNGTTVSWHEAAQSRLESIIPNATNASLVYSLCAVMFCWILLWFLWRKRILIKV